MQQRPFMLHSCWGTGMHPMWPRSSWGTGAHCMEAQRPSPTIKVESLMEPLLGGWSHRVKPLGQDPLGSMVSASGTVPCLEQHAPHSSGVIRQRAGTRWNTAAKNCTLTGKGYTPYQLVYGRHPTLPDLLDEEVDGNLSLRQSLTLDGGVAGGVGWERLPVVVEAGCPWEAEKGSWWPRGVETEFSPGDKAKDGKVSKRPRRMEGPCHHHFEGVSTQVFLELAW